MNDELRPACTLIYFLSSIFYCSPTSSTAHSPPTLPLRSQNASYFWVIFRLLGDFFHISCLNLLLHYLCSFYGYGPGPTKLGPRIKNDSGQDFEHLKITTTKNFITNNDIISTLNAFIVFYYLSQLRLLNVDSFPLAPSCKACREQLFRSIFNWVVFRDRMLASTCLSPESCTGRIATVQLVRLPLIWILNPNSTNEPTKESPPHHLLSLSVKFGEHKDILPKYMASSRT